jgi:hypothetical protein
MHYSEFKSCVVLGLFSLLASGISSASAVSLRTVALAGQPAPGTPNGIKFLYFNDPAVINAFGQTAFNARLTDSTNAPLDNGIWSEGSGNLDLVSRNSQQISILGGGTGYLGTSPLVINTSGTTAFPGAFAETYGSPSYLEGVWTADAGGIAQVVLESNQAPGTPAGTRFRSIINSEVYLNASGHTAFNFFIEGNGVDETNDIGIWSNSTGNLALVARDGDQAPGTTSGTLFNTVRRPVLSDNGTLSFAGSITGIGSQFTLDGIWNGTAGNLSILAREGWDAPGMGPGVKFLTFHESLGINSHGLTAFSALLVGNGIDALNDEGIWVGSQGNVQLVARGGDHAPGTPNGVIFGGLITDPVLNAAGHAAFLAGLTGNGVDDTNSRGMWAGATDDLQLIVRSGEQAPGTPAGARFSTFNAPVLNANGQVAFVGNLVMTPGGGRGQPPGDPALYGFVTATNDRGIWATDANGMLQLIVREGDLLEVTPGDFRTVQGFIFAGHSGNGDGRPSGFNDQGQIVFVAGFTDGTSGVFVSSLVAVPEPAAIVLIAFAAGQCVFVGRLQR